MPKANSVLSKPREKWTVLNLSLTTTSAENIVQPPSASTVAAFKRHLFYLDHQIDSQVNPYKFLINSAVLRMFSNSTQLRDFQRHLNVEEYLKSDVDVPDR